MKSDSTRDRDKKGARQLLLNEFICGSLTALYIHTAYVYYIYLRVYLIGFFNSNLARICQEVASPFALFLMWFISTRAKKYAQTVGGIWSYIQRYIHACVYVCECYPSVSCEVPNARLLFDWQSEGRINCLSGNAIAFTITLEKTRVRHKRARERELGTENRFGFR